MLVSNFSFRELDKKWVLITKKKWIKKLVRKLKIKKTLDPIIAYFYIDKEDGFCLKVIGNIFRDDKDNLSLEEDYIYEDKKLNYSDLQKLEIQILDNMITNYIKGIKAVESSSGIILNDKFKLKETRVMTNIDEFRNNAFPDDVEVSLKDKDDNEEFLWAKIEGVMREDLLICRLLTASETDKDYELDTLVGVKYRKENDEAKLEIKGLLKPKDRNN